MGMLRKSDIRKLNEELKQRLGFEDDLLSKKDEVIEEKDEKNEFLKVNGKLAFFKHDKKWLPTLKLISEKPDLLKKIEVDMGAIKFVTGGADIMRPGIVAIEDGIEKDQLIVIIDTNHKKPLALGIALFGTDEMRSMEGGKAIKNIHYVGDDVWAK